MKSKLSKLLHEVAGRSLVSHAIRSAESISPEHLVAVVGAMRDQVEGHLAEVAPEVRTVRQTEDAYGTGHAVRCALAALGELTGEVVVLGGDVPMLEQHTLVAMLDRHRGEQAKITILSALVPDPTGYGRIVRDAEGHVDRIVEQAQATPEEHAVNEINSSIYVFDAAVLADGLSRITNDNSKGEYYLTDVIGLARTDGHTVVAELTADTWQTEGVNDRIQLAAVHAEMNRRILHRWMAAGVTILDPASTWIDDSVELDTDVTLLPGTTLKGATVVAEGATIGPDVTLTDCEVGESAVVRRAEANLAVIGAGAQVGPYSYLRPGTELGERSKIGGFVEAKNAKVGTGAKVPHLTYAGDAVIGEGANIGAGVIFANYDGVAKHTTHIGRDVFVGSDAVLVAPVTVADGSYVAAGSTITDDVDSGQLAVARGQQRNISGWVERKRAGSRTAETARRASAGPPSSEHSSESTAQQEKQQRDDDQ
ncbi:MAG: bifunctional UDP-N-acetylglucosamine diphosphorylase/glucosamine-1-phosphate N-acetyltransferase GlmU [Propionibacteriales bacterium]|nr:bifunctional UDP-N-acetylglucosamine diphosphorylase/glucosamine-1-phosphate N-acetyltransferase GlmU [Propionibacteriales bacterium]